MKTKLIIVEGMDNTGKSTLIDRLDYVLSNTENCAVKIIHLTKPPKDIPEDEIVSYMNTYYDSIIEQLLSPQFYNMYNYIILDRGYISEFVYGPMYRNRNELDITVNNLIYEKKLINTYKENICLILLNSETNGFLINHDDDNSLSNVNDELLIKEREKFIEGFNNSLICNKKIYNVDKNIYKFNDILPEIINDFFF